MKREKLLLRNIGRLVTFDNVGTGSKLGVLERAYCLIEDGIIKGFGSDAEALAFLNELLPEQILDCMNGVVMPGLIDSHTHLVHAGFRANEFNLKSQGTSYQDLAKAGGGIMATVKATRAASEAELYDSALGRLSELQRNGVTTCEIKTGYGLDLPTEVKMAKVIARLKNKFPENIIGTFLAHIVPKDYSNSRAEYLHHLTEEILPECLATGAITAADIFVEEGAFTYDEAMIFCKRAKDLGLQLHLHIDQFTRQNGVQLAMSYGAASVDHLDVTTEEDFLELARGRVVATLLPGASLGCGKADRGKGKLMRASGVKVAISTDYNPGTNACLDLFLTASLGIAAFGLSCDEALAAITVNAAQALEACDRGVVKLGAKADLIVLACESEYSPLYRYGTNFVTHTIIGGKRVC